MLKGRAEAEGVGLMVAIAIALAIVTVAGLRSARGQAEVPATPALAISSPTIIFGDVTAGAPSLMTVAISNSSSTDLMFSSIGTAGGGLWRRRCEQYLSDRRRGSARRRVM